MHVYRYRYRYIYRYIDIYRYILHMYSIYIYMYIYIYIYINLQLYLLPRGQVPHPQINQSRRGSNRKVPVEQIQIKYFYGVEITMED